MIKSFLFIWIGYWLIVLLLPVNSLYPDVHSAFFLQFSFVFFVLLGYFWFEMVQATPKAPVWGSRVPHDVYLMIKISLYLSLVGTLFLLFDKVFVQGIDYSNGVAVAREAWRMEGVAREGRVSSIFSVIGYLLSSGYFVAAILFVLAGKNFHSSVRYKIVLAVFILLMVNSILAGGRSNVLLLGAFVFATITSLKGWSFKGLFASRFISMSAFISLAILFSYLLYVFSSRAKMTGVSVVTYVDGFLPYLGLELSPWFSDLVGSGIVSNISSLLVLSASYISHSFTTTAAIIEHGPGEKVIVFLHPMNILYKLNLVAKPDSSWFLAGRFPSLPGALFYQFGIFGFFVFSFLTGFLSGVVKFFHFSKPESIFFLSLNLMMCVILILSPILLAVDFMSFPFVFLSFFMALLFKYSIGMLRIATKR
ncbi:hypothetical protein ACU6RQ_05580 [Zobellella denitrificans]